MKRLKLLKINKRELGSPELTRIKGGTCTNYNCQCNSISPDLGYTDMYLDMYSEGGYLPQLEGGC